jgi:2Fe-2S ferredoxin
MGVSVPRITFVQPDGTRQTIEVPVGLSAMEAARVHDVPGIHGRCGGEVLCSTCHCYVEDPWLALLPARHEAESKLIDFVYDPRPQSRLACQLRVTDALDGLVLHVPTRQL